MSVVIWTLHRLFEGSSDEGTSNNCSREDALMMKLLEVLTSDFTVPLAMMIVIIGTWHALQTVLWHHKLENDFGPVAANLVIANWEGKLTRELTVWVFLVSSSWWESSTSGVSEGNCIFFLPLFKRCQSTWSLELSWRVLRLWWNWS